MRRNATKPRTTMAAASTLLALLSIAGCGSDPSPYCRAVDSSQEQLDTFGAQRTEKAFGGYSRTLVTIAKVAPEPIDLQWASLARATRGVLAAHDDVGLPLQDMADKDKVSTLSASDVEVLNRAYKRFNSTTAQRKAVVADAAKTCEIELK